MVCRSGIFCGCYVASSWARVFRIRARPRCFQLEPVLSGDRRSLRPWHILITLLIFGARPVSAVQSDLWTLLKDRPLPAPFIPASQSSGSGDKGGKQPSREQDQPREKRCGERKMRIMFWQQDGSAAPEEGLAHADALRADGVVFVDCRCDSNDRGWLFKAKKLFGCCAFVRSFCGLFQLLGGSIGGTAVAFGRGWQRRCVMTAGDPRGWGRMSTTKISGSINLWIVGLYVAYPSKDSNEGYLNLQRDIMKRGDAGGRTVSYTHLTLPTIYSV